MEAVTLRDVLSCVLMRHGPQCVQMVPGPTLMPMWLADKLATLPLVDFLFFSSIAKSTQLLLVISAKPVLVISISSWYLQEPLHSVMLSLVEVMDPSNLISLPALELRADLRTVPMTATRQDV